jgi:hypothetical protein
VPGRACPRTTARPVATVLDCPPEVRERSGVAGRLGRRCPCPGRLAIRRIPCQVPADEPPEFGGEPKDRIAVGWAGIWPWRAVSGRCGHGDLLTRWGVVLRPLGVGRRCDCDGPRDVRRGSVAGTFVPARPICQATVTLPPTTTLTLAPFVQRLLAPESSARRALVDDLGARSGGQQPVHYTHGVINGVVLYGLSPCRGGSPAGGHGLWREGGRNLVLKQASFAACAA